MRGGERERKRKGREGRSGGKVENGVEGEAKKRWKRRLRGDRQRRQGKTGGKVEEGVRIMRGTSQKRERRKTYLRPG